MSRQSEQLTPAEAARRLDALDTALAALQREVDQASHLATLGLMAATTAHELRNMLTPVLGYARLAEKNPNDQSLARKAIERTVRGLEAAAEILESTLAFASGAPAHSEAPLAEVNAALENAITALARDPSKDGIDVEVDLPAELYVAIRPLSLQQVFMNLILNAVKAMTSNERIRGHRRIRISSRGGGGKAGFVAIDVADNGPGLADGLAGRIFDPFVTSDGQRGGRSTGGTGLGLAICRRLVEEAGGEISVKSSRGKGTTFHLLIPTKSRTLRKAG